MSEGGEITVTPGHRKSPAIERRQTMISLVGIDKAEVLAALYNASHQQGMGFIHARGASGMDVQEARELLSKQTYFDYVHGRVMKVDLSKDELDPSLYDRDNGLGAAERAIASIPKSAAVPGD